MSDAFERAWDVVKANYDDKDVFDEHPEFDYPAYNLNPHYQPDYPREEDQCETKDCPYPARTGEMTYSGGYIGKVTACNKCWKAILEDLEQREATGEWED